MNFELKQTSSYLSSAVYTVQKVQRKYTRMGFLFDFY